MKVGWILSLGGAACLLLAWRPGPPRLMWNATASVPVGLYALSPSSHLLLGDLVVVRPPTATADFLARRGWLPAGVPLLKPVAALPGQVVCRVGLVVTIDGVARARARLSDRLGRPLPSWSGCRTLEAEDIFVLNPAATDSFDGRYFGVVSQGAIVARAAPLWLTAKAPAEGGRS